MKRITAAKRIKTHLKDYRERLGNNEYAELHRYHRRTGDPCPLCAACPWDGRSGDPGNCEVCLQWPDDGICDDFIKQINEEDDIDDKLFQLDELETELDRWVEEGVS